MSDPDRTSAFERILQSINSIAITGAYLGVVWLAIHIVSDPKGPNDVHRYFLSHLTNFVDPTVSVDVDREEDLLKYHYSVTNGWIAVQDVKQFTVTTGNGTPDRTSSGWMPMYIPLGGRSFGVSWIPPMRDSNGISRGESRTGFVMRSNAPPTILAAHAGNRLHYEGFAGLVPGLATPAGKRVMRWTLGPAGRNRHESATHVLERLRRDVHRAAAIGWISDPFLKETLDNRLAIAAGRSIAGDRRNTLRILDELAEIIRDERRDGLSPEALDLIVYNLEWLRNQVVTELSDRRR